MKILMAARRYPPDVWSGTETVFQNLYERARASHEVRLVVGWTRARELVPPEAVAVPLQGRGKAKAWASMARAIRAEVKRWEPDVVLSNSIEVPPTGVPTACIVHDLNFGRSNGDWESRAKAGFYGLRSRGLALVVTVSAASAEVLRRVGVSEDKICVIHNGVDTERFHPVDLALPEVHEDGRVVQIAFPSRILPGKGQHHALDAVARLPRLHKRRAHLTLVGAVADRVYLDQLRVQAYGQPVSIHTDVDDIVPFYQQADVVLFPTVMDEGFGFTAVEAMACGKPVIWFDQPAVREATGGIGVPVPRGDVDAMRWALRDLMDEPQRQADLGSAGRDHVLRHLGWDRVWQRYEAALAAIVR